MARSMVPLAEQRQDRLRSLVGNRQGLRRQLLLDLRKQFDVVIVDTPPVLLVNDALVIARAVDGTCLMVESGRTSGKLVVDMKNRFEAAGLEPLGTVLTKMDFFTTGYGAYMKAYKAYAQDPAEVEETVA